MARAELMAGRLCYFGKDATWLLLKPRPEARMDDLINMQLQPGSDAHVRRAFLPTSVAATLGPNKPFLECSLCLRFHCAGLPRADLDAQEPLWADLARNS